MGGAVGVGGQERRSEKAHPQRFGVGSRWRRGDWRGPAAFPSVPGRRTCRPYTRQRLRRWQGHYETWKQLPVVGGCDGQCPSGSFSLRVVDAIGRPGNLNAGQLSTCFVMPSSSHIPLSCVGALRAAPKHGSQCSRAGTVGHLHLALALELVRM